MTRAIKDKNKKPVTSHRMNMKISIHFRNFYHLGAKSAQNYNADVSGLDERSILWKTGSGNSQSEHALSQDSGPKKFFY